MRTAFYDLLVAQRGVELAQQLVEISDKGVEIAEARIAGLQGTRIDLLQARVESNRAQVANRNAENRLQAAWQELTSVVGIPQMQRTNAGGDFRPGATELDADAMLQQIIGSSPQLAAARQEMGRAQAALRRARAEPTPNVDVQAGFQYDDATDYTIANLQIEIPLPIRNRNQGAIQAASAEWTAASRNVERLELELRNRFASVAERYANATFEVEKYSTSILPDAEASLTLVTEVYERGEIAYLQLLTAQRTNFQTQIEYLEALRNWWQSRLAIEGLLLSNGLASPAE